MTKTRPIAEIERDIKDAHDKCATLDKELMAARLAKFLQEAGVPDGARPIFANCKGERILVDGFEGPFFPIGRLIKKDGSVSESATRRIYFGGDYTFVGE